MDGQAAAPLQPSCHAARTSATYEASSKCQFILWQVPHPEMQRFEVAADEHQRVVLASDGVWDFVTEVLTPNP